MKKKYIQPKASVVYVKSMLMQKASNAMHVSDDSVFLNPGTMEGGNGSDAASRRRSVWGDEEEDEW